ncbi:MAG: hypothetical protein ABI693_20735 [Bryobacteraceae bacterium]
MDYESMVRLESKCAEGVSFQILRMSFGRRLELIRQVRELSRKLEFLRTSDGIEDRLESSLLAGQIDTLYLEWGLSSVDGLVLDGVPATIAEVISKGPEELCREILDAIRKECSLSEDERKN